MKVCKHCATENRNERLFCENCGRYLPAPDPATQSLKPTSHEVSVKSVKSTKKKPHKEVEYVRVSHGRIMKKSTYDWLERRDAGAMRMIWLFIGIAIFVGLLKGCN